MPDTIVVIPCYNEAARLNVAAFRNFMRWADGISLLFVNDGSRDNTLEILQQLREQYPDHISVLELSQNCGKAEAVRHGVLAAVARRPKFIGYWDADLATPLPAIRTFRETLEARSDIELVMGSRVRLLGRKVTRHWLRNLLGRAFATAASVVLKMPVFDTQCGAKMFRATPAMISLFDTAFTVRWVFDVELLARLVRLRSANEITASQVIYELPLDAWEDVAGSKLRTKDFARAVFDLLAIRWRYLRNLPQPVVETLPDLAPQSATARRAA